MTTKSDALSALLAHAVAAHGTRPAVRCGSDQLTYAELGDRSARLAGVLAGGGIGPGDRVAVFLHKSVDSWVAVHGVLWSGAAYVPVDPMAPPEVVAAVLTDADVRAVVVDARTEAKLATAGVAVPMLIGATSTDEPGRVSWGDVASTPALERVEVPADAHAYLMFTSGSTGRPKGIVHTQASGRAYAQRAADWYQLSCDDRMANVAPLHFDQSTFELFSSVTVGAEVVVVSEVHVRMPASLAALVAEAAVTVWYSVPTILIHLLQRGDLDKHDLRSLRWVLFGGEVFPPATLRALMLALPHARFSNVYGPAEVNQCMAHDLDEPPAGECPVPIGEAWGGTRLRVVDADTNAEVPPGEPGELLVQTDTAMAGYWRRDDLTAAAHVDDAEGRWYRTGDLVRRRDDGLIEFGGRRDRQVKIRGNRIELEAVEAVLGDLPGIGRAAVVVVDDADGAASLVAVVAASEVDERDVVRSMAMRLPAHSLPTRVVAMATLPLTGSGKVDANAVRRHLLEGIT